MADCVDVSLAILTIDTRIIQGFPASTVSAVQDVPIGLAIAGDGTAACDGDKRHQWRSGRKWGKWGKWRRCWR